MKQKKSKKRNKPDDSYGLQAIILADSYIKKRFRPLTCETPKMLLPLAGCPMINYAIDLLVNSNVNEIFIICTAHADQLEEYVNSSQWKNIRWFPKLTINVIRIDNCDTVGSALRYMHTLNYIQSKTFILCRGDLIANISLTNIIKKHQQRYKNNTNTLMTCLFKKAKHNQRVQSLEDDLFLVVDNDELLHYSNNRCNKSFSFDLSILDDHDDVEIHHNIIDCGIDICSKQVLSLFEDNFDYDYIRKELFEGVIRSELYTYRIFTYFLRESDYASRVLDWKTYNGVTADIIERWTYPLTLDSNTVSHNYSYSRNNIYKEDNIKIGRNTIIKQNTILGYNTQIGNDCLITKSIIGPNCVIGNNSHIINSYLFENVIIKNNTKLYGNVCANNVVIGNNCNLNKGCILSFGVQIDDNINLNKYTKIILNKIAIDDNNNDDDGFNSSSSPANSPLLSASPKDGKDAATATAFGVLTSGLNNKSGARNGIGIHDDIKYDINVVGQNGAGFLYEISLNDESYISDKINNVLATYNDRPSRGFDLIVDAPIDVPIDVSIDDNKLNDIDNDNIPTNTRILFDKLVYDISECIARSENNNLNMDDVILEITTSVRLAHNASLNDFSCSVFLGLLKFIKDNELMSVKQQKIVEYTDKYCILFAKLTNKIGDQIKVINGLYNACNTRLNGKTHFFLEAFDALFYNDEDIISLEAIQKWNQERTKTDDNKFEKILLLYIDRFAESDSDDDDDDDGEESDN